MKTTTLTALRAVYDSDPCRTTEDRQTLIRCLGLTEAATTNEPADTVLDFAEAARRLGRSAKGVHQLARRGVIRKAKFPGFSRASGVLASEVERLLKSTGCGEAVQS